MVADGTIGMYTDTWNKWQEEINGVKKSIIEADEALNDLKKSIMEVRFNNFTKAIDKLDFQSDMSSAIQDLLLEEGIYDDDVKITSNAGSASSVAWGNVSGKPSTFTPAAHTHNYAGSGSAGGSANSAVKLDTSTAGSTTQPVYFSGGKPVACSHTLGKSVPSNAVFTDTNTWRGIQNNLSSTSTSDSLSAYQGKLLNERIKNRILFQSSEPTTQSENDVWIKTTKL